jgi:hypothetical protein
VSHAGTLPQQRMGVMFCPPPKPKDFDEQEELDELYGPSKRCGACEKWLPRDAFALDSTRIDGRCWRCRECYAERWRTRGGAA